MGFFFRFSGSLDTIRAHFTSAGAFSFLNIFMKGICQGCLQLALWLVMTLLNASTSFFFGGLRVTLAHAINRALSSIFRSDHNRHKFLYCDQRVGSDLSLNLRPFTSFYRVVPLLLENQCFYLQYEANEIL